MIIGRAVLRRLLLGSFATWCCLPYLWLFLTAFKTRIDITSSPPSLLFKPTLSNFMPVYNGQSIIHLLANTIVVAAFATVSTLALAVPGAYLFARQRPGKLPSLLFSAILSTRIAPPIALSLPFFILFTGLGLRGTFGAVVVLHIIFNISFAVWFLRGFFSDVPVELEMAAQVDGQTRVGALFSIVLPLVRPGLWATALFTFVSSWNEYLMASLMSSSLTRPLTPALPGFIAQATTQWGQFCAVALISSLPVLVILLFFRRNLTASLTAGVIRDK
jgi:multiple sugar transport system permease protein